MSIVSDDPNSFPHPPAIGSRRVSVLVGLPVILGCAVLGSIMGVTHPLRSIFSSEQRDEKPADLTLASVRLVEDAPVAGQQKPTPDLPARPEVVAASSVASRAQSTPSSAVTSVRTGAVDRSPLPGASEKTALIAPEAEQVARPEPAARPAGKSHRAARVKRLKRVMSRRTPPKPKTSELELLFSPIFPKK
jgi:hypothetical protein